VYEGSGKSFKIAIDQQHDISRDYKSHALLAIRGGHEEKDCSEWFRWAQTCDRLKVTV
jgi:hypothetical protein